jgi:chaperonin GroEL
LFGEKRVKVLEDIAVATGARFISKDAGMLIEDVVVEDFGKAETIVSDQYKTRIIDGKGDKEAIKKRIKLIDSMVEKTENDFDLEQLEERKAKLSAGVALIRVGAISEIETDNLYERAIDAKEALISALEMGIVVGGGLTFVNARKQVEGIETADLGDSYQAGYYLILEIMDEPIKKLFDNSGLNSDEFLVKYHENMNYGLDVNDNSYKDLFASGIIEPAKVLISALKNASAVGAMILTTDCVMINEGEE